MVKNEVKEFNVYGNVYGVSLWRSGMGTIFEMLNNLEGNKENSEMKEFKEALNKEEAYSFKIKGKYNKNFLTNTEIFYLFIDNLKAGFFNRELKEIGFSTEWLIDQHNKLVEIAINLNKNKVEIEF